MGPKKKSKRAVKDIPIFLDQHMFFHNLEKLLKSIQWPYKENKEKLQCRDQALASLLILSGLRVSEALALKRIQFSDEEDRIILANVTTLKHGKLRAKIILPKEGRLSPFTRMFEQWLSQVPSEDDYVFPSARGFQGEINWKSSLHRQRAHNIFFKTIKRFPHWFRSVCETIYGKQVFKSDAWKLKDFMGLINLDSTSPYVQSSWEENTDRIFMY